jgi:hypothetical protein
MKSVVSIVAAPVLCLAVLGAAALDNRRHVTRADGAPYQARVKSVLDAWPQKIGDDWISRTADVPEAAVQLLRPNTIISRQYMNVKDGNKVSLLIVQCSDSNDMDGHYPPNCYQHNGQPMISSTPRTWQVGPVTIRGIEYLFETTRLGSFQRTCVYDFFVVPGRGIVPDLQDVRNALTDYQRRPYGAAQFQVVFPAELPQERRDEIFSTLIGANPAAWTALNPPGI